GANVVRPDQEDDAMDEPKRVTEHEPLHLPVIGAAPVRPGQEGPADLDLTLRWTPLSRPKSDDSSLLSHQDLVILPSRLRWRRGSRWGRRLSPDLHWGGRVSRRVRPGRPWRRPPDN